MSMVNLAPDQIDVNEVLRRTLKHCPFCGSRALTYTRVDEGHVVFQAHIKCSSWECAASIFANARTLGEARASARARWERRHEPAPGGSA